MLRWLGLFALVALLAFTAPAFADSAVTLKPRIEASGDAITLGDVFVGAGDVGSRPIAPAPAPGQVTTLTVSFLATAAQSAGLSWTPPQGVSEVRVTHPAGARAFIPAAANSANSTSAGVGSTDVVVRRNETVTLTYSAPGVTLSARGKALSDGAVGQTIRFTNLSSSRTVEGAVTGPGAASVTSP